MHEATTSLLSRRDLKNAVRRAVLQSEREGALVVGVRVQRRRGGFLLTTWPADTPLDCSIMPPVIQQWKALRLGPVTARAVMRHLVTCRRPGCVKFGTQLLEVTR